MVPVRETFRQAPRIFVIRDGEVSPSIYGGRYGIREQRIHGWFTIPAKTCLRLTGDCLHGACGGSHSFDF